MCIKRSCRRCRNKYRNVGNFWQRIYNTVENYIITTLQCFQNTFSGKKSRLFLVCSTCIFISSIPQNLDFSGQIHCWSFITNHVDHIPVLKMQASCNVILGSSGGCSGAQDTGCILHLSRLLDLECRGCGDEFPLQVSRRWSGSLGFCKFSSGCMVTSSCCFSLSLFFKCHIFVHNCSPYVKLSNICECLSIAITAFCGLSKLHQKNSLCSNSVLHCCKTFPKCFYFS